MTERELKARIDSIYSQAQIEVANKYADFMSAFKAKDAAYRAQLNAGLISKEDYQAWLRGQVFQGKRWQEKLDEITRTLTHADEAARNVINGAAVSQFANAANWSLYEFENGAHINYGFGLYDTSTVNRLLKDDPDILPQRPLNIPVDMVWNRQHLLNAVTQSIIQGEGISQVADRFQAVAGMDRNSALTNARTAMTGAQNAGRQESYNQAAEIGLKVRKQWMCTLDAHTRDSHQEMDGLIIDVDATFPNGCRYPGDPSGPPEEVYNCRCTMVSVLEDESANYERRDNETRELIPDMSYEEWAAMKAGADATQAPEPAQAPTPAAHPMGDTIDDAAAYWQREHGITLDTNALSSLNFEDVRTELEGLESVMAEFPGSAGTLKTISTSATGLMGCSGDTVYFNPVYYNGTKPIDYSNTTHFHPNGFAPGNLSVHEYGHVLEWALLTNSGSQTVAHDWNACVQAQRIVGAACKQVKSETGMKYADIKGQVSGYAQASASECMAECVADYFVNGTNAAPLSVKVWNALKGELG